VVLFWYDGAPAPTAQMPSSSAIRPLRAREPLRSCPRARGHLRPGASDWPWVLSGVDDRASAPHGGGDLREGPPGLPTVSRRRCTKLGLDRPVQDQHGRHEGRRVLRHELDGSKVTPGPFQSDTRGAPGSRHGGKTDESADKSRLGRGSPRARSLASRASCGGGDKPPVAPQGDPARHPKPGPRPPRRPAVAVAGAAG
jgi:hypothetical protein